MKLQGAHDVPVPHFLQLLMLHHITLCYCAIPSTFLEPWEDDLGYDMMVYDQTHPQHCSALAMDPRKYRYWFYKMFVGMIHLMKMLMLVGEGWAQEVAA